MAETNKAQVNITVDNLDKLQKLLGIAAKQAKDLQESINAINGLDLSVHTNLVEGE